MKGGSIDDRIKNYHIIQGTLDTMPSKKCLQEGGIQTTIKTYNIDDNIHLLNQIGRASKHGVIYTTTVRAELNGQYTVACKLMEMKPEFNIEVYLNNIISSKILAHNKSRHFLFSYKTFECSIKSTNVPNDIISRKDYYIILNELAGGDLWDLSNKDKPYNVDFLKNSGLILNILCQCLLSIASFHKMGYVHQDCHPGNFLYLIEEDTAGYFQYKILDKIYYLKNCGYTMLLYDFGLAQHIKDIKTPSHYDYEKYELKSDKNPNDYMRILSIFHKQEYYFPFLDHEIQEFISLLFNLSEPKRFSNEDQFIVELCNLYTLRCPIKDIMITKLPDGANIINQTPYIIDDLLKLEKDIVIDDLGLEDSIDNIIALIRNPSSQSSSRQSSQRQLFSPQSLSRDASLMRLFSPQPLSRKPSQSQLFSEQPLSRQSSHRQLSSSQPLSRQPLQPSLTQVHQEHKNPQSPKQESNPSSGEIYSDDFEEDTESTGGKGKKYSTRQNKKK
jgi:hypothetical protein